MGREALAASYRRVRAVAERLAGTPSDIVRRVVVHHQLYVDSGENHAFPLVALHGALWGYGFFETSGKLGQIIAYRYVLDAAEKKTRLAMLDRFAEGFKSVNREVFIDTYTNYVFTKHHGEEAGAEAFVHPELLAALNEAHAARAAGIRLTPERQQHVFVQALRFEQEETVAPGIAREMDKFDCPILKALCMKPIVRFSYFPIWRRFYFRNFADKAERIDKALRSFEIAAYRGWEETRAATRAYGVLPDGFFADPEAYARDVVGAPAL